MPHTSHYVLTWSMCCYVRESSKGLDYAKGKTMKLENLSAEALEGTSSLVVHVFYASIQSLDGRNAGVQVPKRSRGLKWSFVYGDVRRILNQSDPERSPHF